MVIYRHKDKYSISEMCRFFKVSRSGYYGYVSRMDIPARDLALAKKIRECQDECGKTYGYRRVHIWLEKHDIHRNPKTVLRVMQKYGLLSVIRRKKYRNYGEYLHKYPNLLNRDFSAERPNQKWVTDISYIIIGNEQKNNERLVNYMKMIIAFAVVQDPRYLENYGRYLKTKGTPLNPESN